MQFPLEGVSNVAGERVHALPIKLDVNSTSSQPPFANVLSDVIGQVDAAQTTAQQSVDRLLAGEDVEIHEVSLQMAQADLSLRFLMEVRNRAISAYQEIMRTQM